MVPAGEATESAVQALAGLLSPGDVVIDGGNNYYKESIRRARELGERGIKFLDSGTSGGIWGLKEGYSLMIGGDEESFKRLEALFQALAPGPDRQEEGLCAPEPFQGPGRYRALHNLRDLYRPMPL